MVLTDDLKKDATTINDVLPKIKGIDVDPMTEKITINNDPNVLMLVNGNLKNQEYIKSISPERILRVEVLRNPTGRYLTEGYSAVINIVLKPDYIGQSLYVEEKGIYSLDKANGGDLLFMNNAKANYTYSYKKVNIYGMYANTINNTKLISNTEIITNNAYLNEYKSDDILSNYNDYGVNHNAILGLDFFINSKNSLSIETQYNNKPIAHNTFEELYFNEYKKNNQNKTSYYSKYSKETSTENIACILTYKSKLSDKSTLNIDYGYNYSSGTNNFMYIFSTNNSWQTLNYKNQFSHLEANFDYTFSKKYSLNIGYHNTLKNNSNNYKDIQNSNETNYFEFRNTIYTYLKVNISKKISSKIGGAFEQNNIDYQNVSPKYNSFQPFFSLFFKKSDNFNISLKFRSYSDYPTNTQISPYKTINNIITSQKGNPLLSFATNYKTSVDFSIFKNLISIEPYYLFTNNFISKTGYLQDSLYIYSFSNVDKYNSLGINTSIRYPIIKRKLFFNFTGTLYRDEISYNNTNNDIFDFSINSNLIYRISKYIIVALMLKRQNSKKITAYGYYSNNNDYLSVFIRKALLKNRLVISSFYVLPVSLGFNYELENKYVHNDFSEISIKNIKLTQNLFMLKITYNFNKGHKIKSIKKKELIEKEEKEGFF